MVIKHAYGAHAPNSLCKHPMCTGLEFKLSRLSIHSTFKSTVSVSNSGSISVVLAVVKVKFPCRFSITSKFMTLKVLSVSSF